MAPRFAPGSHIGPYTILRLIGKGGMGEVYEAQDSVLSRTVALKIMTVENPEELGKAAKLFTHEAKVMAQVNHPNVASFYHLGNGKGTPYIAMEYVEGVSLDEYLKTTKPDLIQRLFIFNKILAGVHALHRKSVIHGDLKPKNIIIETGGGIKIIDFGIAHIASESITEASTQNMGSAHYMAPELSKGSRQTVQSEIWSLGIILYQLVANERPFYGNTPTEVRNKVLEEDISFSVINGWTTAKKYQDIIKKMCRRSLHERYQSINEVVSDLNDENVESKSRFQKISAAGRRSAVAALTLTFMIIGIAMIAINRLEIQSQFVQTTPALPTEIVFPEPAVVEPPVISEAAPEANATSVLQAEMSNGAAPSNAAPLSGTVAGVAGAAAIPAPTPPTPRKLASEPKAKAKKARSKRKSQFRKLK